MLKSIAFRSKNFKGVLSLLAGGTIARIIAALGGIVLAKYYGDENYGIYSVFLSYIAILPVLASFRLDNIIVLQRGSTEIRNLFSSIIIIILIINIFLISILLLLKGSGLIQLNLSYSLLLLCGVGSILTGWNLSQNYLFTKYKLFKQISIALVLTSLISVAFQTFFYLIGYEKNGLIYGWLIGLIASFTYNALVSKSRIKKINIPLLKKNVKENIEVVKYTYPSDAINAIANNIMPILVIIYFTQAEVGVYAMAYKILTLPLILLAGAVSRVYFQKAVSLYGFNNRALEKLTYKVVFINVLLISLFVLFMNTAGIYLFELFFEEHWKNLRVYIAALSFWIIARSAMNPISDLILVIKKNHYALIFNVYLLIANFVGIYFGVLYNDFIYCIWIFSILSGIGYLVLLFFVLYYLKKDVKIQENHPEK